MQDQLLILLVLRQGLCKQILVLVWLTYDDRVLNLVAIQGLRPAHLLSRIQSLGTHLFQILVRRLEMVVLPALWNGQVQILGRLLDGEATRLAWNRLLSSGLHDLDVALSSIDRQSLISVLCDLLMINVYGLSFHD